MISKFRQMLQQISRALRKNEADSLKFKLTGDMNGEKTVIDIFWTMMEKDELSETNRGELCYCLRYIGRKDLADNLEQWNNDWDEEKIRSVSEVSTDDFLEQNGKRINLSCYGEQQHLDDDGIVKRFKLVRPVKDVEKIDLCGNNVGVDTLEYIVQHFPNLTNLTLRRCQLNTGEKLSGVKELITKLNLERIDLYENNLGDTGIEFLAGTSSLFQVKEVILGKNKITNLGLIALKEKIINEDITVQIKNLNLADNKITVGNGNDIDLLGEIFNRCQSLETLNLSRISLGSLATEVVQCLPKTLTELFLINCKLNVVDQGRLSTVLCTTLPKLVKLNIASNHLHGTQATDIVTPLLESNDRFLELRMYDCNIKPEGMHALSKPLSNTRYLTALTLSKNDIGLTGVEDLRAALRNLTELEELWLSDNMLFCEGVRILVPVIGNLTKLRTLALNNNKIRDEGAIEVAKALQKLNHLQKLCLYDNMIGDDGLIAILKSFVDASELEKLVLNSNMIEGEGIFRLLNSVNTARMRCLKEVFIHNNSFDLEYFGKELTKFERKHDVSIQYTKK